ncbi:two-component system CheB/CheR fusion protein [Catalinimonas alkaloidigena]|uniref:CheR family methyltransferase n=1 Tax=Catalinimonas alkaloidigena TaxID=1075417 RepID=UPI00240679FB|nr:CheR family methyltransferase [Catalinimonas alkaloidigena]MDF9797161.1 two-component system CheB/CheR fusion protein [Catalinimonas alkaloidigena]
MHHFYVVGIGCSSSSIADIRAFFSKLNSEPEMSFIIIQNLAQHATPIDTKILADCTNLAIVNAEHGISIEKNKVYLMPIDRSLSLQQKKFYSNAKASHVTLSHAVDTCFADLANEFENKAAGILLSGKGTDGTLGISRISKAGGIVMVQSPDSTSNSEMPQVAITSEYAESVMPPEDMAIYLNKLINDAKQNHEVDDQNSISIDEEQIESIIKLLSEYSNVDFSHYKTNSFIRRIRKRISINQKKSVEEYYSFLKENKHELYTLYNNSLIGVTSFFRNKEAFEAIEKEVIPRICEHKDSYEQIRIWVPACATGEEAYSIAILIEEYIRDNHLKVDFKLFATDLDDSALDFASQACYPKEALKNISDLRISRFFQQESSFYIVAPSLRKKILFVKHNLLKDPPFIRLDLVSCRNLYIYLKPKAQQKITNIFHYALKPGGFLMLGNDEYLVETETAFEKVNSKQSIYRNLASVEHRPLNFDSDINLPNRGFIQKSLSEPRGSKHTFQFENHMASLVLDAYVPAAIVVNLKMEVVYLHGELERFLQLPRRAMSPSLEKMLSPQLLIIIKNGIVKLKEGSIYVRIKDVPLEINKEKSHTNINIRLLGGRHKRQHFFLIEFGTESHANENTPRISKSRSDIESIDYVSNLETELKLCKQELISITQELEANQEELQASHEEMLSSNEELQSTNEELQSSNEELFTANSELKRKIEELTLLNHDINNLFESTDIAILFLDKKLNIRKFTPSVSQHFKIRDLDVGRPLTDLNRSFKDQHFEKNLYQVLKDESVLEKEVLNHNGHYFLLRIIPYLKDNKGGSGLVITFVDISDLRNANKQLEKLTTDLKHSEENLQSLLDNSPDVIIRFDPQLNHLFFNHTAKYFFKKNTIQFSNFNDYSSLLFDKAEGQKLKDKLLQVLSDGKDNELYITTHLKNVPIHFYVKLVAEFNEGDINPQSILAIARDITSIKKAEAGLYAKNNELIKINEYLDEFVYAIAHDLRAPVANLLSIIKLFESDDPHNQERLFSLLSKTVYRLDATLNGLIDMIEVQEKGSQEGENCLFEEVVDEIKKELFRQIEESGAVVSCDFTEVSNIKYNRTYLYSIIFNLLSNAIKYRRKDHTPMINIQSNNLDQQGVMLSISDNGKGIDLDANTKELFKPFRRFDNSSEGMGIGLHIVKNMIERNGGKIKVESELDKGSTFKLYLIAY